MKEEGSCLICIGFGFGFDLRKKGILDDEEEEKGVKIFHFSKVTT